MSPIVTICGHITGVNVADAWSVIEPLRDPLAGEIIGAAIDVHRKLGPGLLENAYKSCLQHELRKRHLEVEVELALPVIYDGIHVDCGFRLDMFVNRQIIVEVKSVERLTPIHSAQVLTYLKLTLARQALLFNFNSETLTQGMRSFLGPGG